MKKKLDELEMKEVITRVDEPTDWVNQMVVQVKKSGDVRLCIDPRPLNAALRKEQFLLPTLDDVLPELSRSRVFTKLDLSNGYWHVPLDEESSMMTTFATQFGRYRWLRLPFGLSVSSEIFQKRLHGALIGLEGTLCVADDIVVHAEDVNTHDQRLQALLGRCKEQGIRLNKGKSEIRRDDITFIGHKITKDGLQADPEKIQGIDQMKRPINKEEIQTLQGTVNYLAKFMPHLSDVMKPIRDLTKQGVEFMWGRNQEDAFQEIKKLATASPVLAFYDPKTQLTLQCDASNKGLGAALLQEGRPIAYKSRALSVTEGRYATIEKEMLVIVWGLEKFHQYTYGRKVQVHSDHKPLEVIMKKPLALAPRRLQNMLMRAMNYDFEVTWKKGETQVIADLLSRSTTDGGDEDFEAVNACTFLSMGADKIKRIQKETDADEVMIKLKETIMTGWPEREDTPAILTPYHSFSDEMTIQDGVIFKGDRVVIPANMRAEMKKEVHGAHGGMQACLSRARETTFWPGMTAEIKQFVETCETCRKYEISNSKETLMQHEILERQWERVGADVFELEGTHYLVTVDYFSNFWELDRLESTKSTEVIRKFKAQCARYGSPCQLVTDNAQQFTSVEFRRFTKEWDIGHLTSSPHYPKSNGMAESAVKTAKRTLRKAKENDEDAFLAVLAHRNTISQGVGQSPAQRMLDRRTRTLLPTTKALLVPANARDSRVRLQRKQEQQTAQYNKGAKDLKPLEEGDVVKMKPYVLGDKVWKKGEIIKRLDERSYEVLSDGKALRRNRVQLRQTKEPQQERPDTTQETSEPQMVPTAPIKNPDQVELPNVEILTSSLSPKNPNQVVEVPKRGLNQILKTNVTGPATLSRSGRIIKTPGHLKDFAVSK